MKSTPFQILLSAAALALALRTSAAAPPKTPELVEKGKASFGQYCSSCHGVNGEGDGPAAKELNPPPRNFAKHPPKGGAPAVFEILKTGVKGTGMFPFLHLPESERWAIAYFVETLGHGGK